jgi:hypothetical protein
MMFVDGLARDELPTAKGTLFHRMHADLSGNGLNLGQKADD